MFLSLCLCSIMLGFVLFMFCYVTALLCFCFVISMLRYVMYRYVYASVCFCVMFLL